VVAELVFAQEFGAVLMFAFELLGQLDELRDDGHGESRFW
jgi:hypothetical protein